MNPALSTSSEPDPSQTYRVNARADLFQSLNVQVELGSTGIVEGVSSTSTNTAFELFSGIAQAIITASTFAAQGAPGKAPNPAAKSIARPEAQSDCLQAAKRVEELAEKGGGTLSCHEQQRIASCLKPMVDERDSWVLKRQELFLGKSRGSLKPEALAQVDGYLREQVSRAQTRLEGEQALFGLNPAKSDEATFRIKVPAGVPPEQKGGAFKVDLDDAMKKGLAAVEEQSEGASKLLPLLTKIIEAKKPGYVVTVSDPPAAGNIAAEAAGFSGTGGYRYRVPSISQVHVSLKPDASANDSVNTVVRIPIAQHGAVAALNSRFVGKGGKVVVKLWPDTGGLKTVEIGADALPTNVVTDVVDKLSAREKERRDAEKKASEDAAKADPELDAAKRERQLLEEKVKIQDLQKQFTGGQ